MNNNTKISVFASAFLVIFGCQSDPFPEEGQLVQDRPIEKRAVPPAYGMAVPDTFEFAEGRRDEIEIDLYVPAGKPLLTIDGLPETAEYDEVAQKIIWNPPWDAGNHPTEPSIRVRTYPLLLTLRSSVDMITSIQKQLLLVVKDTPRAFGLTTNNSNPRIREGVAFVQHLTVSSLDFERGPFRLVVDNLPSGAIVESNSINPNEYTIKYEPGFDEVSVATTNTRCGSAVCKKLPMSAVAYSPSGQASVPLEIEWEIQDTRQYAMVASPQRVEQSLEANFMVTAIDPNFEVEPTITIKRRPNYGEVSVKEMSDIGTEGRVEVKSKTMLVNWKNIPVDRLDQTFPFQFQICVLKYQNSKTYCVNTSVSVTPTSRNIPAPVIGRSDWGQEEIKYTKVNSAIQFQLPIHDGGLGEQPIVEILPKSLKNEVTWSDGFIEVKPKTVGVKTFLLQATSSLGATSVAHFNYEALPQNRSENIILASSKAHQDVTGLSDLLESSRVVNPEFQDLDQRLLSFRNHLFISTSAMSISKWIPTDSTFTNRFKTIFLQSPNISNIDGELAMEIASYGIRFNERLGDTPSDLPISNHAVIVSPTAGIGVPTGRINLAGSSSAEASRPSFIEIALDSKCTPLMALRPMSTRGRDRVIAISCPRTESNRKLIIAGFDWSDLEVVNNQDKLLPKQWLKELNKQ